MKPLLLDDSLPASLAAELERRGRPARSVRDLGLAGAPDAAVLEAAAASGAVLVTVAQLSGEHAAVAVVGGRDETARREIVHRHAHEMAVQRSGSVRRYAR
jgi:predicted nuclease of predicted toxin-antitoxin system